MKFLKIFISTIFTIVIIHSCSKENSVIVKIDNPIQFYSNKFLTDTTFLKFITTISKNNLTIAKTLKRKESTTPNDGNNTFDSSSVYISSAENLTATYFLDEQYPDFVNLSISDKTTIFKIIGDSLSSVSYRNNNPQNAFIQYELLTIPLLIEDDSLAIQAKFSFDHISSTEFWTCTFAAGISVLSNYGSILGDLKWLIQNGSKSWGAVFSLAFDLVKNACPWYKITAMAFGYASCLWNAGQS